MGLRSSLPQHALFAFHPVPSLHLHFCSSLSPLNPSLAPGPRGLDGRGGGVHVSPSESRPQNSLPTGGQGGQGVPLPRHAFLVSGRLNGDLRNNVAQNLPVMQETWV